MTSFSLEDFGGATEPVVPGGSVPGATDKPSMTLEDFSNSGEWEPPYDAPEFLRSVGHGATVGLSEKLPGFGSEESQARFNKFKEKHPWLNATGNVLGGGMMMAGLPLIAAAAPEAVTTALGEAAAPITGAISRAAAPILKYGKDATAGMENFVNPLISAGKASLAGAGWGGAFGAVDSNGDPGETAEGMKEGAILGPLADLGTQGAIGTAGAARRLIEPWTSPMTTARRIWSGMFPNATVPPIPAGVPSGYRPTMGTANPEVAGFEKQVVPDELKARQAENEAALKLGANAMAPAAQPGLAVNEARGNVNDEIAQYQQRAQAEADSAGRSLRGASGNAPPGTTPESASITARTQLDGIQNYYRDIERQRWDALDAGNLTFPAMGKFKNSMNDFYDSLPAYARTTDVNNLMETVKTLPKNVSFDTIQQLRSDALSMARGISKDPFQQGVLNDFADAVNSSVQGVEGLSPEAKAAWSAARNATRDRYERFGNSLIGKYVGAENVDNAARGPSMTLKNILTGSGSTEKFATLLHAITPEGGVPNAGVINSVKQFISSDIADRLGGEVVDPHAVETVLLKYRPVINQSPELQRAFGTVEQTQASAYAARQMAEQHADAVEKSAASAFMGADPGDPASIDKAVGRILASKTPRQDVMNVIDRMSSPTEGNPQAMNGLRRAFVDKMMDGKSDPHEFIDKNRAVLDALFPSRTHQQMLDGIADASRQMSDAGTASTGKSAEWKDLTSNDNYLSALVGRSAATGANIVGGGLGAAAGAAAAHSGLAEGIPIVGHAMEAVSGPVADIIGAGGGAYGTHALLTRIYRAPRDKVVQIIKDGLMDPNGVGRKLTRPVNEINSKEVSKYVIPGITGTFAGPDQEKLGFAHGGRVELEKSKALLRKINSTFPLKRAS